jgi:hypothetical protein
VCRHPEMLAGIPITSMDIDNTELIAWRLSLTADTEAVCTLRCVGRPSGGLSLSPTHCAARCTAGLIVPACSALLPRTPACVDLPVGGWVGVGACVLREKGTLTFLHTRLRSHATIPRLVFKHAHLVRRILPCVVRRWFQRTVSRGLHFLEQRCGEPLLPSCFCAYHPSAR